MVDVQIIKAAAKKARTSANQGEEEKAQQASANPLSKTTGASAMTASLTVADEALAASTRGKGNENAKGSADDNAEFLEYLKAFPAVPRAPVTQEERDRIRSLAEGARKAGDSFFADTLFQGLAGLEVDGELTYAIGKVTNHNNIGFTPYLDEDICKLCGPLPLTIFNKKWQQKAIAQHLEKRTRKSASVSQTTISYKGFPFTPEWDMNFAAWTNNHQGFYKTLLNVYGNSKFATLLKAHKEHCDDLIDEYCFMVAFC
ncbi:hypothetical protein PCANC_20369 [Puccinia coronata f. sp. avenae]|uniref:Uncharacterized protein n=1 Tax=Puccinia coronata f. sp. avenae TaxID=200324 RepID=A0A2N5UN68_9BASI|nr:hypothetical protein PCANC_20369 [Puccinia coronata f. sp. avenae]PLW39193.1 hypothetical protein PCASD_07600 [Puccinia coronata f. sp. avenae]